MNLLNEKAKYKDRLYRIWYGMLRRCHDFRDKSYKNYGLRGIKVCKEWFNNPYGFLVFYAWAIQNGYQNDLTIERIDVNGNYEPDNCTWITREEQAQNKTTNILIWDDTKYISLTKYVKTHTDVVFDTQAIHKRIKAGIPPYIALYCEDRIRDCNTWVYENFENLTSILVSILNEHPNLLPNKYKSAEDFANIYLKPYTEKYYSQGLI